MSFFSTAHGLIALLLLYNSPASPCLTQPRIVSLLLWARCCALVYLPIIKLAIQLALCSLLCQHSYRHQWEVCVLSRPSQVHKSVRFLISREVTVYEKTLTFLQSPRGETRHCEVTMRSEVRFPAFQMSRCHRKCLYGCEDDMFILFICLIRDMIFNMRNQICIIELIVMICLSMSKVCAVHFIL